MKKILICIAALLVIVAMAVLAFDARLSIKSYKIRAENITENVRIALITDLHSCKYGEDEAELIEAIDAQKPDVIMLGGDIFDDEMPTDNAEALLRGISSRYPCYYVTGNHEYWSDDIAEIMAVINSYNVTVLDGKCVPADIKGQRINICGVSDPDVALYDEAAADTETQLSSLEDACDNGYYTILLAHRPELIEAYASHDFDMVLAGHAHGGQVRIPGIMNGLVAPGQGLFPKYAGGEYAVQNTKMIVSRGLAKESTRAPRVFNRPELVIIDLAAE